MNKRPSSLPSSREGGSGHELGHVASYSSTSSPLSGIGIQRMPAYHTSPDLGRAYNMSPDLGNAHQMSPNLLGATPNIATLTPYGLPSTEYNYDEPRFQHVSVFVNPIRPSIL